MTRFKGKVTALNRSKGYGWIDLDTVAKEDGSPHELATTKGIYVHLSDAAFNLDIDTELTFGVVEDTRRSGGLRAKDIERVRVVTIPEGIELHVDAKEVDNPSVPMRWCYKPETLARITEGLKKGYGYAVVLVGKQRSDDLGYREIREVHRWNQPFAVFTFGAPDDWDVSAILYERQAVSTSFRSTSNLLELELRSKFLDKSLRTYDFGLPDLREFAYLDSRDRYNIDGWWENGKPISVMTIDVSVPREIFAPEPHPAVIALGNYFFRDRLDDQCDLRGRLLLMIPGIVPWLVIEGAKRVFWLLAGIVCGALFWMQGSWPLVAHALKPAVKLPMPPYPETTSQNGRMKPFDKNPRQWLVPGALLAYGALLAGAVAIAPIIWGLILTVWVPLVILTGLVLTVAGVVALAGYLLRKHNASWGARYDARVKKYQAKEEERKSLAVERGQREAALAVRHTPVLMCGDAPAEITLKAIPRELRTKHMLFASFKRRVCLPFAR